MRKYTQKPTSIQPYEILTAAEIQTVLRALHRTSEKYINTKLNLTIFRLSCCCGLRASEIGKIRIGDFNLYSDKPTIAVPACVAKGGRPRRVPLDWDEPTLEDLQLWSGIRRRSGAPDNVTFVCSVVRYGRSLNRGQVAKKWLTALKPLGADRRRDLSIHAGRKSFCSHALHAGYDLVKVRDAMGHASVSTTNLYLHAVESFNEELPNVFGNDFRSFRDPPTPALSDDTLVAS